MPLHLYGFGGDPLMPLFRYEAEDAAGRTVRGALDVRDEQAAAARLLQLGYRRPRLSGVSIPAAAAGPVGSGPVGSGPVISDGVRARIYEQLHLALKAGMSPFQAVSMVAVQAPERPVAEALQQVARKSADGQSLSDSILAFPGIFLPGDRGLIRAAETGGFLPSAFRQLSARCEEEETSRRRLAVWLWYFHLNVYGTLLIIPMAAWLREMTGALSVTAGLGAAAISFLAIALPLGLAYTGLLVFARRARFSPRYARAWHRWLLKAPVAKQINYLRGRAVFARSLHALHHAGVDPAGAWEAAALSVPNMILSERWRDGAVIAGESGFARAFQVSDAMDPADAGMIAVGEATGELETALNGVAGRCEEELRQAMGASTVRGITALLTWTVILSGIATVLVMGAYGQGLMKLMNGFGE